MPVTTEPTQPKRRHGWVLPVAIIAAGLAVVIALAVAFPDGGRGVDRDDDEPGRRISLTEAACNLLDDGENPEFVYDVMKDLAADHPLTYGEDESIVAREAVRQAQAQIYARMTDDEAVLLPGCTLP